MWCGCYDDLAAAVAPEIQLPNRRMGQALGRETILECIITAYPQAVNYWEKDGRRVTSSSKYRVNYWEKDGRRVTSSSKYRVDAQAVNYWEKDGRRVTSSSKYRVDAYDEEDNKVVLSLRIYDIEQADYGEYTCVAANELGRDQETMYLYGTRCTTFFHESAFKVTI